MKMDEIDKEMKKLLEEIGKRIVGEDKYKAETKKLLIRSIGASERMAIALESMLKLMMNKNG